MTQDGFGRHTPTLSGTKVIRALSIDGALLSHVGDAIAQLTFDFQWVEVGDSIEAITQECQQSLLGWYSSNMLVGQISGFLGSLPDGWLALDGATYNESEYPELFEALDSQYKAGVEFSLPDFSGLFLVGVSSGVLSVGDTGGEDSHALSVNELPAHSHSYTPPVFNVDLEAPGAPDILAAGVGTPVETGITGSGDGHENRPPFIAVNWGIFAGRV